MSKRDVELLIKAKDEGTRVVNNFVSTLKDLQGTQEGIERSSASAGSALSRFADAIAAANKSGSNNDAAKTAQQAYVSLAASVDKASDRVSAQAKNLTETKAAYAALGEQIKAAEAALVSIAARQTAAKASGDQAAVDRETQAYEAVARAIRQLKTEYTGTGGAIRAQTAAIEQAEQDITRLQGAAAAAQVATRSWGQAAASTAPQLRQAGQAARDAGQGMAQGAQGASGLRGALNELYGDSRKSLSLFQRLRGEVLSLAASFVGFYGIVQNIGGVISAYRDLETAQNRLGVAFEQNDAAVSAEMTFLRQEAQRLGIVFTDLAKAYGNITINAKMAGLSTRETRDLFLSLAEAGRVVGLSQDDMNAVFKAFEQIMNKGKFSAEELRGQLGERLPGAVKILAAALGVTTSELDKMMQAGEVIADRSTLAAVAERLREQFGPQLQAALQNTTTEIGRFQDNLKEAQLRVAEGGFIAGLTVALRDLNIWFQSDDGVRFFNGLGAALGKFMGLLPALLNNIDRLVLLFQVFTAIKVGQAFMRLGVDANALKIQFDLTDAAVKRFMLDMAFLSNGGLATGLSRTVTGAVGALGILSGVMAGVTVAARAMWVAVGGLPGLVITALTFIASQLLGSWLTGVDKATEALQRHEELINQVRNAYVDAADDVNKLAENLLKLSRVQLEINADKLKESLNEVKENVLEISSMDLGLAFGGESGDQVLKLVEAFNAGKISAAEFKAQIDALAQADPELDRHLIDKLLTAADKAIGLEDAMKRVGAAIRAAGGNATETDRQLLGLANAADQANNAMNTSAIDSFNNALGDLIALAPSAAGALRNFQNAAKAEEAFNRTMAAAQDKLASSNPLIAAQGQIESQIAQATYAAVLADQKETEARRSSGGGGRGGRSREMSEAEKAAKKAKEALDDYRESQRDYLRQTAEDITLLNLDSRERQIQAEVFRQSNEAREAGLRLQENGTYLTNQELELIRFSEGAKWDAANAEILRQEAMRKAAEERAKAQRDAEEGVSRMQERQRLLQERLQLQRERGDMAGARQTEEMLKATNAALDDAIQKAIDFWTALGGPDSENAILVLQNMKDELKASGEQALITSGQMKDILGDKLLDAWDNFAKNIADGKNVFASLGEAFLQFAADFLREIARMIAQQIILNLLQNIKIPGIPGMGGSGGGGPHMASLHHSGGIAGHGPSRLASAAWFQNARRMHTGGIAGLRPDEVPAILQRGEEVLTAGDPRHARNGGGQGDIKIINTFDPGEFMSKGLSTSAGERAILNFIRANAGAVKGALA